MITFAPERPGALEAIRVAVDHGVVAAIGHTNATYAIAQAGIEAGLHTVLVMTGISDQAEIDRYPFRPSEVISGVHELVRSEPIEVEM